MVKIKNYVSDRIASPATFILTCMQVYLLIPKYANIYRKMQQ